MRECEAVLMLVHSLLLSTLDGSGSLSLLAPVVHLPTTPSATVGTAGRPKSAGHGPGLLPLAAAPAPRRLLLPLLVTGRLCTRGVWLGFGVRPTAVSRAKGGLATCSPGKVRLWRTLVMSAVKLLMGKRVVKLPTPKSWLRGVAGIAEKPPRPPPPLIVAAYMRVM